MANSAIAVANMALSRFGSRPIQSFSDTTPAGAAMALIYPVVIDGLLSEVPWSFTRAVVPLQALNMTAPDASGFLASGFRYAFGMPENLLQNPSAYLNNPRRAGFPVKDIEVQGGVIYANATPLWAVVSQRVDPADWPPYFLPAAVACLAAESVMAISGNASIKKDLAEEAWGTPEEKRLGGKLGTAKQADARNQGSKVIQQNPLTDARWG